MIPASTCRRPLLVLLATCALAGCGPQGPTSAGGNAQIDLKRVDASALQKSAVDARVRAFYAERNGRPAWTPAMADQLKAAIADLQRHAVDGRPFLQMLNGADPTSRELALTKVALAYGDTLAHGLADPAKVYEIFALERNSADVDKGLSAALDKGDLRDWLAGLPPQDQEYATLSKAYVSYLKASQAPQAPEIPEGKPIKPSAHDPRMPQIAQTLAAQGLLDATAAQAATDRYDPTLVAAMKTFQNQQGVNDDGVIGADTIQLLNSGPLDRARQIALNLENRRWIRRDLPPTRIEVNTAAAVLSYYKDGKLVDQRRVVAGQPNKATPLLSADFSQLVVNPPWNVPDGIAQEEILPKGEGYLQSHDMYVEGGHVIQRPGPKASLGLVKFDMQDKYAIYLHDTPSKAAFRANERHGSHGCVRVDDAVGFARKIAADYGVDADFEAKLAKGDTGAVPLKSKVPVYIMYHTAFADDAGRIGFRPDVYGWDEQLATALNMPVPAKRTFAKSAGDVGP